MKKHIFFATLLSLSIGTSSFFKINDFLYKTDVVYGNTFSLTEISSEIELQSSFFEGFGLSIKDEKYGYIDKFGNEIIPFIYDDAGSFANGQAVVKMENALYGFIDTSGKITIQPIYSGISNFEYGLAPVIKNNQWGVIDQYGNEIIPCKFAGVEIVSENAIIVRNSNEFTSDSDFAEGTYGLYNKNGEEILPIEYYLIIAPTDGISPIWVNQNGKWGAINHQGDILIPMEKDYMAVKGFSHGISIYKDEETGLCGIVNQIGEDVIHPSTNNIVDVGDGLSAVLTETGEWGLVNKSGYFITTKFYDGISVLTDDGMIAVVKDGKYGYLNSNGVEIIPPIYDKGLDFSEGLAGVSLNDKWGYINVVGTMIVEPIYDFVYSFTSEVAVIVNDNKYYLLQNPLIHSVSVMPEIVAPTVTETVTETVEKLAVPTNSNVVINGVKVDFEAYNIENNNYFKLRDLAFILMYTKNQFDVTWDEEKRAINLLSDKSYTLSGGEMSASGTSNQKAIENKSNIYLDGNSINMLAYTINGNNFFKLRDVGEVFGFLVDWDSESNSIIIETEK